MDFPIELTLKRPVSFEGRTIDKLVFDEPDLGTSIAVEEAGTPALQTAVLLAGMAGVEKALILKVKESDFREIRRTVLVPYNAHVAAEAEAGND
ncbi:hypothetical protein [Palleronia caenipelagi]|uniref:Phage tail assembly protein n=1 Tax=Palleronia caenipelagi TaxID=2489174 RepID=A0A547PS60_9RHOB|nr:hypothetical protein [Palleronia caenipelagi]TRD16975.1 hypothetical protein FEV53_13645 [Palleronia caenipelagi]